MEDAQTVVLADDWLLRRIRRSEVYYPAEGPPRPFSSAFRPPAKGEPLSLYVERILLDQGLDPDVLLIGHEDFNVVAISVELVIQLGLHADLDPDPDDPVEGRAHAHALVHGVTKGLADRLAAGSVPRIWED